MTKAQCAGERADTEEPLAPSPRKGAITEELPAADQPDADDNEDPWHDEPTVSNRIGPSSGTDSGDASTPAGPPEGAGTYRILRPTTSDVIETPAPARDDAQSAKRTVIGAARKPRP